MAAAGVTPDVPRRAAPAAAPVLDADATRWEGAGVRADAVARQLLRLRQMAGEDDSGYALTRASVMNLLVGVGQGDDPTDAIRAVDQLALRHPSRAIILAPVAGARFSLDAEVVIHRHAMAAHGLIFERALLRPHGADPSGFDTLVIPLLIPHLQSVLWWLADPDPEDPGMRSLAAICDRLIVDTSLATGGSRRLGALAALAVPTERRQDLPAEAAGRGRAPVLGDTAWTRLEPLREALARVFDEGRRARWLDGLSDVEITAARGARRAPAAAELLLAGWLASRLGHSGPTPLPEGGAVQLNGASPHLRVAFTGDGGRGERRQLITAVTLRAKRRGGRLVVELAQAGGGWTLRVTEGDAGPQERTLPLARLDETEALSRELARMGRDRVYEDALQVAARIEAALDAAEGPSRRPRQGQ